MLYSNSGINEVSAPSFEEIKKLLKQSINELRQIASNPQKVDGLTDIQAKRKFAKALAEVVGNIWNNIKLCPTNYKGLNASNIINERIEKIIDDKTTQIADEWCLDKNQLVFLLDHFIGKEPININADFDSFKLIII